MTSAKRYREQLNKRSLAWNARNTIRRAINPTPAEMRDKTAKLKEANRKKEERVKALEESRRARVKAQRLREREAAARRPITTSRSTSARIGDPTRAFDTFANHPLFGGGTTQYNDAFSTHPLFGGGGTTQRERTTQRKGKQQPPKEFDWNLI